ncbi:hydrophobic protein [Kitasatospora sp. NPDC058162]|uniref:hydrophobic protein n=1 Tax=Kitasatospora sp. NPDC058162 TaxID=3346362 RepID=UPI0036DE5D3E
MLLLVLILLLALILGGAGFAIHILWWVALAVLVLWVLGFVVNSGGRGGGRRWYRW